MRPVTRLSACTLLALSGVLLHSPAHAAAKSKPAPARKAIPSLVGLEVQPTEVTLVGPRAERKLLITGKFSDGQDRDLTGHVLFSSSAPKVARAASDGVVTAASDGEVRIKVVAGKLTSAVKVVSKDTGKNVPISFKNEVIPVLTKLGCNQGACHGSQLGKGGFKLSLLGYDPDSDYVAIVRQNEGRRVAVTDAEQSLLLQKPLMGVPHAGGRRFKTGDYGYKVLLAWLQDGTPAPLPAETDIASLEVLPKERVIKRDKPGQHDTVAIPQAKGAPQIVTLEEDQHLVALAKFKDGSVEDVTRRTQFNSLNDAVAEVTPEGEVTLANKGETAVMVRYRGQAMVSRFTVPYRELKSFPAVTNANYVDERVSAKWKVMGLIPSGRCTDAEFIRRAFLDVLGTLPTPDEVRAFLASTDPKKREKLVDTVLNRPEYVDYWALKWGDLLRNNRDKTGDKGMWSFYNWLRASFRDNKPMDQFAKELVTAQGSTYSVGPANYFRVANNPGDLAETTAQVFLGVRLTCARCHHHPYEKWSQDDYWQMAAFFSRFGLKNSQEFGLFGGEQVVRLSPTGEVGNPRTGKVMKPTPLDGEPVEDPIDRRRGLAAWLGNPSNSLFSRSIVNRYWGYMLGRGIVEPIDDMRVTNPPSNPELLDALAKDFVEHKYDPKHLLRTIMLSETYQLSSNATPDNKQDEVFYTKYAVKRMGAEELLDAIGYSTGTTEKFPNLPAGLKAIQLPDPGVPNYFLDTFGRPARVIACECERAAEPNMAQALHLMNSDFVQNKVASGDGRVAKLLAAKKTDEEIVEELYLVTFSRVPTLEEVTRAQLTVLQAPTKKEGFEDLLWALMNSREYLFKH